MAVAVTEAINKIDGASAKVNLKKKEAVVSYEKVVEDAAIREAVEKAGYTIQSIQGWVTLSCSIAVRVKTKQDSW